MRLRDIGQVWELALQLMFYASPIIYPIGFLPPLLRHTRVPQPVHAGAPGHPRDRALPGPAPNRITVATSFGSPGARLIPIAIALGVFAFGLLYFRSREHSFAEQV